MKKNLQRTGRGGVSHRGRGGPSPSGASPSGSYQGGASKKTCSNCGYQHDRQSCPAHGKTCRICEKLITLLACADLKR